jgi:sigma-B regulation protein RsbU (phosphoserine phosphatase)
LSEADTNRRATTPIEDLEDLYENAPCGYLSIQPDGRIFKVNATFSTWTGFSNDELTGKRLHDLLNVAGRIFYETHFAPLLRMQGFFDEVALDLVAKGGKRLPTLVNARERRDADGQHLFTRLIVLNASDRRRYERELVEARGAAETANKKLREMNVGVQASLLDERETAKFREQFIAVLGHDLRNPLASIDSGLRLQLKTTLNERATTLATMMLQSTARMSELIDNVLDLARGRLGGGIRIVRNADQPLRPVLRQVVAELRASWPGREILEAYNLPLSIDCDRSRIAQLTSNLLANALTYGAADMPIRIEAATGNGMFELSVANSGDPIPPVILDRLFEPFERGAVKSSQHGLGLGLYIASEIARAHGGKMKATSSFEETRFTFQMPLIDSSGPPSATSRT